MHYDNQTWILRRRPVGQLRSSDLELVNGTIEHVPAGECLIKTRYLAMDPATRGWMGESGGYMDPLPLDGPVFGVTVGEVIVSKDPQVTPGTVVMGLGAWGRYSVGPIVPGTLGELGVFSPTQASDEQQIHQCLHALGTSGATAWYGLLDVARMQPGDKVFVSAAGGSVGSLVVQIAKLRGAAKVVGCASSAHRCEQIVAQYGADACIDYRHSPDLRGALAREFPDGIDVYFDNVGGEVLEAVLDTLAPGARIAACGMISQYNDAKGQGAPIRNLWNLLVREATMTGFLVSSYFGTDACGRAFAQLAKWLQEGQLRAIVDERDLFHDITRAYNLLFSGEKFGRLIVRVPD
ncbi:MAG: NADP-dependent oxidoreductase [Pseudomonadota bacterium]